MTPGALRMLAARAAERGEWIKAADLQGQAADLETLAEFGRDPYNAAPVSRPAPKVYARPDREPLAMLTTDQLNEAERLLAGSRLTLED